MKKASTIAALIAVFCFGVVVGLTYEPVPEVEAHPSRSADDFQAARERLKQLGITEKQTYVRDCMRKRAMSLSMR